MRRECCVWTHVFFVGAAVLFLLSLTWSVTPRALATLSVVQSVSSSMTPSTPERVLSTEDSSQQRSSFAPHCDIDDFVEPRAT